MDQHPDEHEHENILNKDDKACKSMENLELDGVSGGFDCNICLDSVHDPVVTLCGHLYCWPCIYKWIHHQNDTSETIEKKNPRCPVCSCDVSEKNIVPLYGRGQAANHVNEEKSSGLREVIPPRPPTPRYGVMGTHDSQISHRGFQQRAPPPLVMPVHGSVDISAPISPSPTIGMLGEMVSGRILGDLDSPLFPTPNSYSLAGVSTRRARRQATQADRSLSRIYAFLFCCIILCLLLFT
ncbi:putative transcription factor C2H2 family [Helianthus anomalus]